MRLTLTPTDQRALWSACEEQWERHRKHSFWRVELPSQEWEDIRSAAFARVFRFVHRYDPAKGDLSSWTGTVIRRIMMNELRKSLPSLDSYEARTAIQHAQPIVRHTLENKWGDQWVMTWPDTPCRESTDLLRSDVQRFRQTLTPKGRRVVDLLLKGASIDEVRRRLRWKTWQYTQNQVMCLGDQWRAFDREAPPPMEIALKRNRPIHADPDIAQVLLRARRVPPTGMGRVMMKRFVESLRKSAP